MSADYQMVLILAIVMSFLAHDLVFKPMTQPKILWQLLVASATMIVVTQLYIELPSAQSIVLVLSFSIVLGIYGGTYDCLLRLYVRGRVLRYAYLSHVGILSGLITWSTRWVF